MLLATAHWPVASFWATFANNPLQGTFVTIASRIMAKAMARMGKECAVEWYQSFPLPGYSGFPAKHLVDAGRGEEVIEYFKAVDAGVFA